MAFNRRKQPHEREKSEPPEDTYVTIKLSKEFVESLTRAVSLNVRRSIVPFLVGLVLGGSGVAGIADRLVAQPEAPATPEIEEVCPQQERATR